MQKIRLLVVIFISIFIFNACGTGGTSSNSSPSVSSTTPSNSSYMSISSNILVVFSTSMNENSLNSTNVILTKLEDSSSVSISLSYNNATKTLTINPDSNLSYGKKYKLSLDSNISDTNGKQLSSNYELTFSAKDTVTHNSIVYGIVTSPITSKKWLDRNLGATKECDQGRVDFSSDNDYITSQEACFGNYYEWGRNEDGHEKFSANITTNLATSITSVGHGDYILNTSNVDWTSADTSGALRQAQWNKTNGASICPLGYRVPTSTELYNETTDFSGTTNETTGAVKVTNRDTAYKNFLKLPVAGARYDGISSVRERGNRALIWTNTLTTNRPDYLIFHSSSASKVQGDKNSALSIRCIKN